ncbi:MAG: transcriptional regulator NrdR [Deltaproteobacteria bacterium]|nr:transcriptional regulator NrdR [Deltaproteobacteria bacterium]
MKCPFCSHAESKVIDSRESGEGDIIRRRRECESCQKRYTTYERVEEILPMIVKKDGRREAFDRLKLLSGLKKACEKRPVSVETLEKLADAIEQELQGSEKEVPSTWIGEKIMDALHDIDPVAYVRFASVYRSFKDVNEFMDELKGILKENKSK